MKIAALTACAITLSGCAAPHLQTRDQWLRESQRTYEDRDPEQVIRAAEAVLTAVDPGDVTFAHSADGFTARRRWVVYVVIASAVGEDVYEFKAVQTAEGTRASIRIEQRGQASDGRVSDDSITMTTSYKLFFNWLDYALGKRDRWITCDQAGAVFNTDFAGSSPGMCAPGITSRGANPVQPRPELTKPTKASKISLR